MLNKSLVEARIVPIYSITSEFRHLDIVIPLPSGAIYIRPQQPKILRTKNKKYSRRRLLREVKRGCKVYEENGIIKNFSHYQILLLTETDLKDIVGEELVNKILNRFAS